MGLGKFPGSFPYMEAVGGAQSEARWGPPYILAYGQIVRWKGKVCKSTPSSLPLPQPPSPRSMTFHLERFSRLPATTGNPRVPLPPPPPTHTPWDFQKFQAAPLVYICGNMLEMWRNKWKKWRNIWKTLRNILNIWKNMWNIWRNKWNTHCLYEALPFLRVVMYALGLGENSELFLYTENAVFGRKILNLTPNSEISGPLPPPNNVLFGKMSMELGRIPSSSSI